MFMLLRRQNETDERARFSGKSLSQEKTALEAIHASVEFLLEALAEDLNAPIPSKEPAFLYVANDRVCLVRSLVERLESARSFLDTVEDHFGSHQSPTSSSSSK
ncbi:MAG: hypothetical protein C5B47_00340 [Verrucomicrobia bacterium]|nr:MAG: hypothetical protein C5B47_00340 [Verrucomicrobiota bacterium]